MRVVYKYTLAVRDLQEVELPAGAQILEVAAQHGHICLWALVDPLIGERVPRIIAIAGTGHPVTEKYVRHISTFQMENGAYIFHAFECFQDTDEPEEESK